MNTPEHFQVAQSYACYRAQGRVSFQEATNLVSRIIAFSRDHQINRLLVDITKLTGFSPPDTFERFWVAEQFAAAAMGSVKVVLLAKPEMIDPDRFGVTVARNRGLVANVFGSEPEALGRIDYPRYRALGLPIGSGQVEAQCKTLVGARCKQAGMRNWTYAGAEAVLRLRAARHDGTFEGLWEQELRLAA